MSRVSFAITLLLIAASLANAQKRNHWLDPEYEGAGFAGGSFGQDFQFHTSVLGSSVETSRTVGVHYGSGYVVGGRVNQNVNDYWGAALEYSFANQPLQFTNL